MKHILFDGDIIVYRAGFAAQKTVDGTVIAKPAPYAYAVVNSIVNHVKKELCIEEYSVFLTDTSHSANFRSKIHVNKEYKGNRKEFVKPVNYKAIREYLISKHNAILISGEEADDALGYVQCERGDETVIASIDKDLLQIPGWHYNTYHNTLTRALDPGSLAFKDTGKYGKKKLLGTGFMWFAAQMLLGDVADNIKGLDGYGQKKVLLYFQDASCKTFKGIWNKVSDAYKEAGRSEIELWGTAQLLWIRRKPNQMFSEKVIDELESDMVLS